MSKPEFCPRKGCRNHSKEEKHTGWCRKWGYYHTRTFGMVPRYRCNDCGKTFSDQTFSLDYYAKKRVSYQRIFQQIITAGGVRDTARQEGISTQVVQNRTARLAHQAMAVQISLLRTLILRENLCADGFESFTVSQYFPNNIALLVGQESQMVYHANYVTIRRKGRMTEAQKKRRMELEKTYRAPGKSIQKGFELLMHSTADLAASSRMKAILLITDMKKEYPRAIRAVGHRMSRSGEWGYPLPVHHITISSRISRTVRNWLFPVNYLDRQIRKDVANHVRETVQFARNVNDGMNRLMIYFLHHNCLKPYRIRRARQDPRTHAEIAGIDRDLITRELSTLYTERRFLSHLEEDGRLRVSEKSIRRLWMRGLITPLKNKDEYCPAYYTA